MRLVNRSPARPTPSDHDILMCVMSEVAKGTSQLRHNRRDGVSNHRRLDCLLDRLFSRRSKKTSKLRVTGLCEGNSPVTGEFPAQRASNAGNVSIWWRHHVSEAAKGIPLNIAELPIIVASSFSDWCDSSNKEVAGENISPYSTPQDIFTRFAFFS